MGAATSCSQIDSDETSLLLQVRGVSLLLTTWSKLADSAQSSNTGNIHSTRDKYTVDGFSFEHMVGSVFCGNLHGAYSISIRLVLHECQSPLPTSCLPKHGLHACRTLYSISKLVLLAHESSCITMLPVLLKLLDFHYTKAEMMIQ